MFMSRYMLGPFIPGQNIIYLQHSFFAIFRPITLEGGGDTLL